MDLGTSHDPVGWYTGSMRSTGSLLVHSFRSLLRFCLLVLLLVSTLPAQAEVSPETRAYLAAEPKGAKELWKKAREAFDRSAWDDGAALGEAILRLGKEHPRVLCLIARCRARTGASGVARSLVQRALELKPGDPDALSLSRELGPESGPAGADPSPAATRSSTTLAERLFGEVSTPAREALHAYYQDRLDESLERANSALSIDPGDPTALFVRALIHRDRFEREEALRGLEFLKGRFPKAAFLEFLGADRPDPLREQAFHAAVEADPQADPLSLALLAQYKRVLLQCGAARRILKRAEQGIARPDRETLLALSAAALKLNEIATSQRMLDEYKALFGEDSWWMVARAQLLLFQGQPEEAVRLGAEAYRREPQRLLVLPHILGIFRLAGKEAELLELLKLARKTFPDRAEIEGSFAQTAQLFLKKLSMRTHDDDIFHLAVQQGVPAPVVALVLSTFKDAHRKIGALFGYFPQKVKLVIFDRISGMPGALAYFSPLDDTVYVGGVHYQAGNPDESLKARTVSEHEFTHYVHAELQRQKGLSQRVHGQVKWLSEGLAEWASDGLDWRLKTSGDHIRACLVTGTVPLADLESPAIAADPQSQIKGWYLQGNFMVRYLLGLDKNRSKQIDRLITLSLELTQGEDLGDCLKKHFGIDAATFERGYTDFIRREAIRIKKGGGAASSPAPGSGPRSSPEPTPEPADSPAPTASPESGDDR